MARDLTIYRPDAPKYKNGQTVYSRVSAVKGFIEPLYIHDVEYDSAKGQWLYTFRREAQIEARAEYRYGSSNGPTPSLRPIDLISAKLYESQIITYCEAINLQVSVLQREYDDAVALLDSRCGGTTSSHEIPASQRSFTDDKFQTVMPKPMYGVNETVYLLETAQASGRLEPIRISEIKWNSNRNQWSYVFRFEPRPERNMTVGDRGDWKNQYIVIYNENELVPFCVAQSEVVKFLDKALRSAQYRKNSLCPSVTD